MNKTTLLILSIAVLLLGGFLSYRHFSGSAEREPATAAKPVQAAAKPPASAQSESSDKPQRSQATMSLAVDDDPVGTLRLEGQAVDENGAPVEGATIVLNSAPSKTTVSDTDGSFAFDNLVGRRYTMYARSSERIGGPAVVSLTETSAPTLVRMHAGGGIRIEVYDDHNHPIAGATVSVPALESVREQTDSEGKVTMSNLPPGSALLVASAPGYAKSSILVSIPRNADTLTLQRFSLVPGVKVSGTVVDNEGKPVANAKLIAHDNSALFGVENPKKDGVSSNKDGKFELPAVPSGAMRLHASHDDFAPSSTEIIHVGDTPLSDIEVVMSEGGIISGSVVSLSGDKVAWATVRIVAGGDTPSRSVNRQLIADENGKFSASGLPLEELLLQASSEEASSKAIDIDLLAKTKESNLKVTLDVEGTISGVVVDEEGQPIAEAQVQATADFWKGADLKRMTVNGSSFATTNGDGEFHFRGLSDSMFQLRASRSLGEASARLQTPTKAKTGDTNIRITIASPGSITGTIQTSDGTAPEIAVVSIRNAASASVIEGKFSLADIPAGKYELTIKGPSFATKHVGNILVTTSETTELETIVVEKGRVVRGQVVDSSGSAVSGAKVVLSGRIISDGKNLTPQSLGDSVAGQGELRQAISDDNGKFALAGLGSKQWFVVADHPDFGRSIGVDVPKGTQDTQVDLPLLATGSVAGRVSINGVGKPGVPVLLTTPATSGHILVVQSGDDGRFLVERTTVGDYKLSAMISGGAASSMAAMQTVVKAGQETEANLDIEEGAVTYTVQVSGKNKAKIDAAQVFLFSGAANINNGSELNDLFLKSASNAKMAFATKGMASFLKVTPGNYSVCVLPINGDMNDPAFAQKLQRNVDTLAVHCQQTEIAESPENQSYNAVVPPMAPLPDE